MVSMPYTFGGIRSSAGRPSGGVENSFVSRRTGNRLRYARMRPTSVCLLILFLMLVIGVSACLEKTIKTGVPVVPPKPTPPLKVEANISLDDFKKLCNFLPEEGDRIDESETADAGKTVRVTLGNTKRRQNPSAMRAGCTPGQTFDFSGPELRLTAGQRLQH